MKQTQNGEYILAGATNSYGSGSADVYLIKTDNTGRSLCNESLDTTTEATVTPTVMSVVPIDSPYVFSQIPATITGSGGVSMLLCLNTGEEEVLVPLEKNNIAVYPNPASNEIFVLSSMLTDESTVSIVNMVGETLFTANTNSDQLKIDIQDYLPGVYFVTLTDKNKSRVMKKFVKM
jgi:hypothetical protein